ncbi:ZirU family protein [Enterobacter ludwigii]|uniref:ZirU family protein n=1 Tax=Enterobacter ludwigii TaxID=299767 RepID=UPI003EF628CD
MTFKKTILALGICATLFSMNTMANTRANDMVSPATSASVGHRPVATTSEKKLDVTGDLTTGSILHIDNVYFTDVENDTLDLGKMNNAEDIKWFVVNNDADTPSGTPAGTGTAFTIPGDAGGKKIKVVYRIKTASGNPDSAFLPTTVLLTTASSGVGGDSAVDGTISNKLKSVKINVLNESGKPTDELNGTDVTGTPVVGGTLEAVLECAASSAADCDVSKYNYTWQIADASAPNAFTDLNNSHAEPNKYVVKGTEQNKLFRVHVTPKSTKAAPASKRSIRR